MEHPRPPIANSASFSTIDCMAEALSTIIYGLNFNSMFKTFTLKLFYMTCHASVLNILSEIVLKNTNASR